MSIAHLHSSATVLEATEQTAQILALRRPPAVPAGAPLPVLPPRRRTLACLLRWLAPR